MLTQEQTDVIAKVQKLLALAGNNTNEHEAQAATQKAMDLLSAYNLSMHSVGKPQVGKREDKRKKGGLYAWQRELWNAVCNLNFCMYWSIKGLTAGSSYEHRILGSEVNVVSAEVMADYLQGAIERLAQAWAKKNGFKSVFVREAIAYREGMAHGLVLRLNEKRRLQDEADKAAQEEHRRNNPTGNGIVLADVANSEADLNTDYINGYEPGTTARKRAEAEARRAAATAAYWEQVNAEKAKRAADPAYDAACKAKEEESHKASDAYWAAADAKSDAATRRRMKNANKPGYDDLGYKLRYRLETAQESRQRMSSFGEGHRAAEKINLDKQVDKSKTKQVR